MSAFSLVVTHTMAACVGGALSYYARTRLGQQNQPSVQWDNLHTKLEDAILLHQVVDKLRVDGEDWEAIARKVMVEKEGHCRICALPLGPKHVSHGSRPPDLASMSITFGCNASDRERFKKFRQAFVGDYQQALLSLSKSELLTMPIPFPPVYTQLLVERLQGVTASVAPPSLEP